MATRRVTGQGSLPGAPESLLQASGASTGRTTRRISEYLGISVQRTRAGEWRALKIQLDTRSGRIVPTMLDTWTEPCPGHFTAAQAVLYWAQQEVLDERGVLD